MSGYQERIELFRGDPLERRFASTAGRRGGRPVPTRELLAAVDAIDPAVCQRLALAGGNPQEHPGFAEVLARALGRGLAGLTLVCEARAIGGESDAARLRDAGVEALVLVVGGARAAAHEVVMRDPGGHAAAMRGLEGAMSSGVRVYVLLPLLRRSAGEALPLISMLLERGKPDGVLLALPPVDSVPVALRPALLGYAAAARVAAEAFERCRRAGVEYGFAESRGIPPCASDALDPFATVYHQRVRRLENEGVRLARVPACDTCSIARSCGGVEGAYVDWFGPAGFEPVSLERSMGWRLKRINRLEEHDYKNVSAFDNDAEQRARSLLRVNGHCQMACSFCFVDRTVPDYAAEELERQIQSFAERQTDHLVLSGGEPTLHPDLPRLIRRARELGFRTIEIQTNGMKLRDLSYAQQLVDSGLNKATVSLHSVDPTRSDEITKLAGAFPKTVEGLRNLRRLGVTTQIAHVITKANYRELPDTVRFLREALPEGAGHLSICFAIAQGISDLVYSWVIPTFTEIKPFFREALDFCIEAGIGFGGMIGQGGYPPCMLDGRLEYYADNLVNIYRSGDHDRQFYKPARCRECSFDAYCIGVRRDYVACFGDDEIRPFTVDGDALRAALPVGPGRAVAPREGHMQRPGLVRLRRSAGDP